MPRSCRRLAVVLLASGSVPARAEVYHPDPALRFSKSLQVVEVNEREAFNASPDGGTPATTGESNLALAAGGAFGFESSRIADSYGDDKLTNGAYGVEVPDNDDATRPWIAADFDNGGFAGVLLGEPSDLGKIGFGSRFANRADGLFTLQATAADFSGVDIEDPTQVNALEWTTLGTLTSAAAGEFGRHLVTFEPVEDATAVRIVVGQGGTSITEIEVYAESDYVPPPPPPPPDPPASATPYTNAVLADIPVHYYRFEETHGEQPAKDAIGAAPDGVQPGAFLGDMAAGQPSAFTRLGKAAQFGGTAGTYVDLGIPFHPGSSASIEAWALLDPTSAAAFAPVAARWDGSYELDVNQGSGRANFVTRDVANTFALVEGSQPFTRGEWHHVVGIFDAGVTTIYVDGAQGTAVDNSASGLELQDFGATLFIGATRDGAQFVWKGLIDEVAFYDYALTKDQINVHIAAAQDDCIEDRDSISISGPAFADPVAAVELEAAFAGADPGSQVSYLWERLSGNATLMDGTTAKVKVTSATAGEVALRVTANDGVCASSSTAEHLLTFIASDPPAPPTGYTQAVLADGPIHYYRFEETHAGQAVKDAIGPAPAGDQPGAFQGGVAPGQPGAFGPLGLAAVFDGLPGSLVNLGTPFHPGPNMSVEAWALLDPAATAAFHPLAARWDGSYELDVNEGSGRGNFVSRATGDVFALAETVDPFTKGEWHHVVGVFDQGITTLYLDGVQGTFIDNSAVSPELQDAGPTLFIGSTRDGGAFLWKGLIDEVAFYDYALTPEQIAAHFEAATVDCMEDPDLVTIEGPTRGGIGEAVDLSAQFTGLDAGATAVYRWSLVSGVAGFADQGDGTLRITCAEAGDVVVRVDVRDGRCRDQAFDEHTVSCAEGGGFHRGDVDQNDALELTDAVQVLGYLFLGSATRVPECPDAADADDNGTIELTDAVRILTFLFLGGGELPLPGPPPAACGDDPSADDELGCTSHAGCQ